MSDEKVIENDFKKEKEQHLDDGICDMLTTKRRAAIEKLPRYRGEVNSKNNIRSMPNVEAGQIFWVNSDNKAYLVAEKDRKKMTIKALDETATMSTGLTLYDMNKGIISKEPLFKFDDQEAVDKLKLRLREWFDNDTSDEYYLLYGRNIHYLTLFQVKRLHSGGIVDTTITPLGVLDAVMESIENVGGLISMDFNTSDGEAAVEIWIRTPDSSAELLYLFPYDKGLVKL